MVTSGRLHRATARFGLAQLQAQMLGPTVYATQAMHTYGSHHSLRWGTMYRTLHRLGAFSYLTAMIGLVAFVTPREPPLLMNGFKL